MKKNKEMTIKSFITQKNEKEISIIYKPLNNKKLKKLVIFSLGIGLTLNNKIAFASNGEIDLSKFEKLGETFIYILQTGGYWLCLIMGLMNVLKELAKGGDNFSDIGKVILKYILAFASLYMLPYFFDIAKGAFS